MERSSRDDQSSTPRRRENNSNSNSSSEGERERSSSSSSLGCGRCLKMKVPIKYLWKKSKNYIRQQSSKGSCKSSVAAVCATVQQPISINGKKNKPKFHSHGGFRYDPLSYAQNFDEGVIEFDNQDDFAHNFSSRFAALPASKSTGQYKFLNQ